MHLSEKLLSPAELHISEDEYAALVATFHDLTAGALQPVKNLDTYQGRFATTGAPTRFNMNYICGKFACGTAVCIGGSMAYHLGCQTQTDIEDYVEGHPTLQNLFYPSQIKCWSALQPEHAAKVIKIFLETGVVDWKAATPKEFQYEN